MSPECPNVLPASEQSDMRSLVCIVDHAGSRRAAEAETVPDLRLYLPAHARGQPRAAGSAQLPVCPPPYRAGRGQSARAVPPAAPISGPPTVYRRGSQTWVITRAAGHTTRAGTRPKETK